MSNSEVFALPELAQKFHDWRRTHTKGKGYPSELWEAAIQHTRTSRASEVARAIGVSCHYLQAKIQQKQQAPQFIEVLLPPQERRPNPSPIDLQISGSSGIDMAIKFEGSLQELIPMVKCLFGKGELV